MPTSAKWRIGNRQFNIFATLVAISTKEKCLNRDSVCFLILQTPKNIRRKMSLKRKSQLNRLIQDISRGQVFKNISNSHEKTGT